MLYDNALLILAYCKAYCVTNNVLYLEIAEKTADYILRERSDVIKVFIYADKKARAERIVNIYGENDEAPEKIIRDKTMTIYSKKKTIA